MGTIAASSTTPLPLAETIQQIESLRHLMTPEELALYDSLLQPTVPEIEASWRTWYGEIYGKEFMDSLDSIETDDRHHSEALEWHWEARKALLRGERPPNDWFAYFPIWARGNMKSSLARALAVCDACISVAAGQPGYTLFIGSSTKKIRKTADTIEVMLHSPKIQQFYPTLSQAKRSKTTGGVKGWTIYYIQTKSGHIFEFTGLEEGMAGANVSGARISMMIPDDIDTREDSPIITARNLQIFTSEVLPMGQSNTLLFFAQNLISRYSVMYQIQSQKQRILTNRKPTKPVPAVRDLVTEPRTVHGIVRDVIVSGKPTWRIWNLQRAQDELNSMGLAAFLREMQHEVEESREGLVLQHWNDSVHVITWSEFAAKFGCREIPRLWNKYNAHDWARTKTKFHANVDFSLAVSSQNSAVPGCYFAFNCYSFPAGSSPEDVAERILTGIAPQVKLESGKLTTWTELFQSILRRSELESHNLRLTELIEARRTTFAQIIPKYVEPVLKAQNYLVFRGSHEQSKTGALEVYQRVFGIPFQACVDEGDVLTLDGWVPIQDIQIGDYVYSCDLEGVLDLKRVQATQRYWYQGDMVKVRSKGLYQSFTPDHQILFRNDNKGQCKEKWRLRSWAENLNKTVDVIRAPLSYKGDGDWEPPVSCVSREDWVAFLGLWLAEGCVRKEDNGVCITQCSPHKQPVVRELLDRMPWEFKLRGNGDFVTNDYELHSYLSRFGKAHEKSVPRQLLQHAASGELAVLLKWMMFGDGTEERVYFTVSPFLANDVCEIALKLGYKVFQKEQPCHCVPSNPAHRMAYVIYLSRSRFPSTKVAKKEAAARLNSFTEPFEGMVYDLTVEDNHTFVIRQQGRVWISGNCNPSADGGTGFINLAQRVDYTLPHPFKPGVKGYTRFFLVVDDDKAEYRDALSPDDLVDSDLFRYQMKNWRFRDPYLTAKGEMEGELLKLNDDFGNAALMLFYDGLLQAAPMNHEEQVEVATAPGFTHEELQKRDDLSMEQKALNEWFARAFAERALGKPKVEYDEYGEKLPQKDRRWAKILTIPVEY